MKRSTMIVLLIFSLALIAGGVLVAAGYGWRYSGSSYDSTTLGEYDPAELTGADIRLESLELRIYDGSWDKTLEVEVSDNAVRRVSVEVLDGVLTIREKEDTGWTRFLPGRRAGGFVLLWLPKGCQWPLTAVSSSGGITLSGTRTDETPVSLTTGSGDISVYDCRISALTASSGSGVIYMSDCELYDGSRLSAGSGGVLLYGLKTGDLGIETTSGGIRLSELRGAGLDITTGSGSVYLIEPDLDLVSVRTTSGDVELDHGTVDDVTVAVNSGDVSLAAPEALRIQISAASGDVTGTLAGQEGDYTVSVRTTSGRSDLSSGGSGQRTLDVTTTSGDVELGFEG